MKDNFLTQHVKESAREGAPLDLLFVNREGFVGDMKVGGCSRHSNHKILFSILREGRRRNSRPALMDCLRPDFHPFRKLVDRVPWKAVLKSKGAQEGWTFVTKQVLKGTGSGHLVCQKTSLQGRTPSWLHRALAGIQEKEEIRPLEGAAESGGLNLLNRKVMKEKNYKGQNSN